MLVVVRASVAEGRSDPVYRAAMMTTMAGETGVESVRYGLVHISSDDGAVVSRRGYGHAQGVVDAVNSLRNTDASLSIMQDAREDDALAPMIEAFRGVAGDAAHVLTALTRRKTVEEADALCELGRCAQYAMEARVGASQFRGVAARTGHQSFAHELALPHVRQMHYGLQRGDGLSVDLCHADAPRSAAWRANLAHASESLYRASKRLARAGSSIAEVEHHFAADMAQHGLTTLSRAVGCAGYRGCAALCGSTSTQPGEVLTLTADFVDSRGDRALLRRLHRVDSSDDYRGGGDDDDALGPLPSWRRLAEQLELDLLHENAVNAGVDVHPSMREFVLSVVRLVGGHAVSDLVGSSVKVVSDVSAARAQQFRAVT